MSSSEQRKTPSNGVEGASGGLLDVELTDCALLRVAALLGLPGNDPVRVESARG